MDVTIYHLRRALDSAMFASVEAAQKICETVGTHPILPYCELSLQRHLKLTDHGANVGQRYYNQSGVNDQLIDFGNGFARSFDRCAGLDDMFSPAQSPADLETTIQFTHRTVGVRLIKRWVEEGLVTSPVGRWSRLLMWLKNFF